MRVENRVAIIFVSIHSKQLCTFNLIMKMADDPSRTSCLQFLVSPSFARKTRKTRPRGKALLLEVVISNSPDKKRKDVRNTHCPANLETRFAVTHSVLISVLRQAHLPWNCIIFTRCLCFLYILCAPHSRLSMSLSAISGNHKLGDQGYTLSEAIYATQPGILYSRIFLMHPRVRDRIILGWPISYGGITERTEPDFHNTHVYTDMDMDSERLTVLWNICSTCSPTVLMSCSFWRYGHRIWGLTSEPGWHLSTCGQTLRLRPLDSLTRSLLALHKNLIAWKMTSFTAFPTANNCHLNINQCLHITHQQRFQSLPANYYLLLLKIPLASCSIFYHPYDIWNLYWLSLVLHLLNRLAKAHHNASSFYHTR